MPKSKDKKQKSTSPTRTEVRRSGSPGSSRSSSSRSPSPELPSKTKRETYSSRSPSPELKFRKLDSTSDSESNTAKDSENRDTYKVGDVVTWEVGTYRGVIKSVKDGKATITITHVDGDEVTPETAEFYPPAQVHFGGLRREDAAREIKTIPAEGVHITHFYQGPMTASEFIDPNGGKDNIEITSHGLGSGIYGIAGPTREQLRDADPSTQYNVLLKNPLYLQDSDHGAMLSALSRRLQKVATTLTTLPEQQERSIQKWLSDQPEPGELADEFVQVLARTGVHLTADEATTHVKSALGNFVSEYNRAKNARSPVAQPINFLLMGERGYDGVYATDKVNNTFNRGCVSYAVPDTAPKKVRADQHGALHQPQNTPLTLLS
ncbi:hypothetical protein [Lentzea sp. NPDC059081]|uniref:hypothetical protein n=1 Tax=Lentzea sp. NPDC059081 TaxID=3346719 RepID=UPI00367CD9B9